MSMSTHADYPRQKRISRQSAEVIVPLVLDLIKPQSVVDVGCGIGAWLSVFRDKGVSDIAGLDGDWVPREHLCIPELYFQPTDLRKVVRLDREFDLVVSLEVAEHLPSEAAGTFVSSLTHLGPVILFSAAIPHQQGPGHVNEQWPEYWMRFFNDAGYDVIDCIRPQVWNNQDVCWWFAQNTLLYARRDIIDSNPRLAEARDQTSINQLSLVHPRKYLSLQNDNTGTVFHRLYRRLKHNR